MVHWISFLDWQKNLVKWINLLKGKIFFKSYYLDCEKLSNLIYLQRVTRKVAQYLSEVLEHEKDKLAENLMANNGK